MLRNTDLKIVLNPSDAESRIKDAISLPIVALDIFFVNEKEVVKPILMLTGTEKRHIVFDLRSCGYEILEVFLRSNTLKVMSSAYEKVLNIYKFREFQITNIADILILEQLITNNYFFPSEIKELDDLSEKYLGFRPERGRRLLLENIEGEINEQLLEFLRIELLVIYRIFLEQVKKIKAFSLERVSRLESNLIKSLARISHKGIFFDVRGFLNLFSSIKRQSLIEENPLLDEKEIERLFNYGVKGDIRLENLLSEFAKNYKDPAHILCQNANELIKRTKLPESRIHSRFIQIASASGRSSSQGPNLFAIPKTRLFREYFLAPEGRVIITLDYSTFELGVLSALSKDPHFLKAFRERLDLHSYVAELMFSKKVSKTENPELRRRAKAINFGIIYGMTAQGLARRLGIDKGEATRLIKNYYMLFPSLYSYIQDSINTAIKSQELRTLTGRRCLLNPLEVMTDFRKKALKEIIAKVGVKRGEFFSSLILKTLEDEYFKKGPFSEEMYIKRIQNVITEGDALKRATKDIDYKIQELYRFIRNMPIQGTAADIMKLAITNIDERLFEMGKKAFMVNIVHDEILIEADYSDAAEIASLAKEIMKDASRQILKVLEIDVDCNIGKFWGDSSLNHLIN
ncbi:MAG: DNA polymerase [Myxococcota bacterium]